MTDRELLEEVRWMLNAVPNSRVPRSLGGQTPRGLKDTYGMVAAIESHLRKGQQMLPMEPSALPGGSLPENPNCRDCGRPIGIESSNNMWCLDCLTPTTPTCRSVGDRVIVSDMDDE